jgi:hypothetical protein
VGPSPPRFLNYQAAVYLFDQILENGALKVKAPVVFLKSMVWLGTQ